MSVNFTNGFVIHSRVGRPGSAMPWYVVSQGSNVVRSMVEGYTTCLLQIGMAKLCHGVHVIFVSALQFPVDGCGMYM